MTQTTDQTTLGTCDRGHASATTPHQRTPVCEHWRPLDLPAPKPEPVQMGSCDNRAAFFFHSWGCHPKSDTCVNWRPNAPAPKPEGRTDPLEVLPHERLPQPILEAIWEWEAAKPGDAAQRAWDRIEAAILAALEALRSPAPAPEETTLRARVEALARKYDRLQAAAVAADIRALCDAPAPAAPEETTLRARAQAVVDAYDACRSRGSFSGFWSVLDDLAAVLDGRALSDEGAAPVCEKCSGSGKYQGALSYAADDNCTACGGSGAAPSPSSAEPSAEVPEEVREAIETLAKLEAKATPGPWTWDDGDSGWWGVFAGSGEGVTMMFEGAHRLPDDEPNARLIVAMRNALPALLRALRGGKKGA